MPRYGDHAMDAVVDPAGADAAAATDAAAAQTATPSPADVAAAAAAGAAAAPANAAAQGGAQADTTGWPAEAVAAYERARTDAARYQREAGDQRINAKANAAADERKNILAQFTKLLDPAAAADVAPTVETLTQQIGGVQSERDTARRGEATVMEAWAQGIDPAKLGYLQYQLSQSGEYGALDPTAGDFGDKLKASIAAQVAKDATLKLPGGAQASGVESLGGASGSTAITPEAFARMSMAEKSALYSADKATYDKLAGNAS